MVKINMHVWKSYIWSANLRKIWRPWVIIAVMYRTESVQSWNKYINQDKIYSTSDSWSKLFGCIEMVLTITMTGLPHYALSLLSSTPCIVSLAPTEHYHNHRIFFHCQEWTLRAVHLYWTELQCRNDLHLSAPLRSQKRRLEQNLLPVCSLFRLFLR